MKLKTFTFLKHKTYLFSTIALMLGSVLSALPAYSQVDYYYGLNKTGVRFGIGAGVSVLQSNWSSNPPGATGLIALDYDLSPYFSVGLQGEFGALTGKDVDKKLYYNETNVFFAGGNLNFKIAAGQFIKSQSTSSGQEILKRIYIGAGIGSVYGSSTLKFHYNTNEGLQSPGNGKVLPGSKTTAGVGTTGSASFGYAPVNFGTNIPLRGFLGSDKVELNPNFQYNFVFSPLFDGYQPNSVVDPNNQVKVNGNQAFSVVSLTLRYKF